MASLQTSAVNAEVITKQLAEIMTKYYVPNFRNTYINSTLLYGTDEAGNFIKSIAPDYHMSKLDFIPDRIDLTQ